MSPAGEDSTKPKRTRPFFKRSRQGCLVCRKRHKKCDENFVDGSCQRCKNSGYECVLPSEDRRQSYSSKLSSSTSKRDESSNSPPSGSEQTQHPMHPGEIPAGAVAYTHHSQDPSSSAFVLGSSYNMDSPASYLPKQQHPLYPAMMPDPAWQGPGGLPTAAGLPFAASAAPFLPLPVPFSPTYPPPLGAEAYQGHRGSLSMASTPTAQQAFSPVDIAPLSQSLSRQPTRSNSGSTNDGGTPAVYPYQGVPDITAPPFDSLLVRFSKRSQTPPPWGLQMPYDFSDSDSWRDLDDFYFQYVLSWISPRVDPVGAYAMLQQMADDSATVYCVLMMIHNIRERLSGMSGNRQYTENGGSVQEAREILSTASSSSSLSQILVTASTLRFSTMIREGAAAANRILAFSEELLDQQQQPRQVMGDAAFFAVENLGPLLVCYADLGRCLSSVNRRPSFSFPLIDIKRLWTEQPSYGSADLHALPPFAAVLIGRTLEVATTNPPDLKQAASEIEISINSLKGRDSYEEIWLLTVRIIFYTRVLGAGALHRGVRAATMSLLKLIESPNCPKALLVPLFLAGIYAITEDEKQAVRTRWPQAPERVFEEALTVILMVWKEHETKGHNDRLDWRRFMEREGRVLSFF